ncbi:endonuclease/exonuclease/phosphatase family protein [Kitasatospora sp. NPDC088783]|uniref:endonuclease/exonuclease/phosphatase family protein n=1 Tax=Kitasatospora sp. NPDC088783 TaxID=3364077 RepID=UPI00382BD8EC
MTTTTPPGTVTVLSWNLQKARRLDAILAALRRHFVQHGRPDVLMLNEVPPRLHRRIARELGMRAYPAPAKWWLTSRDFRRRHRNVILLDPAGALVPERGRGRWRVQWLGPWLVPAGLKVRLCLPGGHLSRRTLTLLCVHLAYWSAQLRLDEATWIAAAAVRDGELTLIAGDFNSWTVEGAPLSLAGVRDLQHALGRAVVVTAPDGTVTFVPDTRPYAVLVRRGLAHLQHQAARLDLEGADDGPTTGHDRDAATQRFPAEHLPPGGPGPIDWHLASAELADPAVLVGSTVLRDAAFAGCSDHLPLESVLSGAGLAAVMDRKTKVIDR